MLGNMIRRSILISFTVFGLTAFCGTTPIAWAEEESPLSFYDDFETDQGWTMFEEIVGGNTCYADGIGTVERTDEEVYQGEHSLRLFANAKNTLFSNHLISFIPVSDQGHSGSWRYEVLAYIDPGTEVRQVGPEFGMHNTREVSPGVFHTGSAGLQYWANPWLPEVGSWALSGPK